MADTPERQHRYCAVCKSYHYPDNSECDGLRGGTTDTNPAFTPPTAAATPQHTQQSNTTARPAGRYSVPDAPPAAAAAPKPERKLRTITLTGRPPVRIAEDDWPVLAEASTWTGGNGYEANATRHWTLKVRQHQTDGRTIVYGAYRTSWQGERDARGGQLLAAGAHGRLPQAIQEVCTAIGASPVLAQDCLADLPPEDLTGGAPAAGGEGGAR